jgi:hypothetical protein
VIITRERHAFEGQSLAVISSIRRRGGLLVLVVLPDGSRSLIPASWTDWRPEQARQTPADDATDGAHDLGRLGDLLHLRKIIDALYSRHVESSPCKESSYAIELGVSRPIRSSSKPISSIPVSELGPTRRSLAHRSARYPRWPHRPNARAGSSEGGER